MVFPWQEQTWQRLLGSLDRLPHALLLSGPAGTGKRVFAEAMAQRVLCEHADGREFGCGKCVSCRWLAAGNHPDFRLIAPQSEAAEDDAETPGPGQTGMGAKGKKASKQIVIDQVRALNDFIGVGTHRRGLRVILLDPAEAMNTHTANALLKLLEEPTPSTLFLMISRSQRRLLPTIRSRCQAIAFDKPDPLLARKWLVEQGTLANPDALLAFTGGMPLLARELGERGAAGYRQEFVAALAGIDQTDPLQTAAHWDGWLKRKDEDSFVPRLSTLVVWLQKWVFDLALWKLSGRSTYHPEASDSLGRLAARSSVAELFGCYNELNHMHRIADHPLNARLFLDDMLLRYARAVAAK